MITLAFGAKFQQLLCKITFLYSYEDLSSIIPNAKNSVLKLFGPPLRS